MAILAGLHDTVTKLASAEKLVVIGSMLSTCNKVPSSEKFKVNSRKLIMIINSSDCGFAVWQFSVASALQSTVLVSSVASLKGHNLHVYEVLQDTTMTQYAMTQYVPSEWFWWRNLLSLYHHLCQLSEIPPL